MPRRFTSLLAALLCAINGLIPPGALVASQTMPAVRATYAPLLTANAQPRAAAPSAEVPFARPVSVSPKISQVQPIVAQSAANVTPQMTNLPLRGDVNGDGVVNVSDIIYLVNFFLANGAPPVSQCNADVTDDNSVQVNDTFYLINYLLDGGPAPVGAPCAFPPLASNDSYSVAEGGALNVSPGNGVLANDHDPAGGTMTAAVVTQPAHGTLTLNADGSFTYVHDGSETSSDAFTYRATSGTQTSPAATVTILVTPVNDAPIGHADAYAVVSGGTLTVAAPGVLANDIDAEGSALSAIVATQPANGALTFHADGSFTYVHNGAGTIDSFTYQATDGSLLSAPVTVSIAITSNLSPSAVNDSFTVAEGGTLTAAVPGVLANDSDPESATLTATLVTPPAHGTLTLNTDGSFTYIHDGSETTTDSFRYQASDGVSSSNVATATIAITPVNDPPVAANDSYVVSRGGTITIPAPGVAINDSDPEGSPLTVALASAPLHGKLTLNADGSFTYTHDGSDPLIDLFTYRASDGSLDSLPATVVINVAPNSPPVANGDSYATIEGGTLSVGAGAGVLANDTDPEGSNLRAVLVSTPSHGTLTLQPSGAFTYVHDGSNTTSDSFTYRAADEVNTSAAATVLIAIAPVNDPPVAAGDAYNVLPGATLTIAAPGVLSNDVDSDSPTLTAILESAPAHGTLTLNANGSFSYTNDGSSATTDSFTYRASDGLAVSAPATVSISIGTNQPPVAVADSYTVAEGGTLNVPAAGVLANDSDPENSPLTAVLVAPPAHGTLTLNANGSFTYLHDGGETTSDTFTYQANDGLVNSAVATVTITVTPVNDAPVAANDAYSVVEGGTLAVTAPGVLANDTDVDSPTLTAALVAGPAHGTLTLNSNGSFTYTPAANFNGADSFTYTASDGALSSNTATVTITVAPLNGPPVAAGDSYTTAEDTALVVAAPGVLANDVDAGGAALTAIVVTNPSNGTLALNANGGFTYTPAANFNGADSFTYKANNGTLDSLPATVTINVTPVDDAPVAAADSYATAEDTPLVIAAPGVLANDTDIDSATLTAVVATTPSNGTLSLNANGSFTYTPNANFNGTDSFTYTASDGSLSSAPATVTIAISAVNDAPVAAADAYPATEDTPLVVAAPGVLANDTDVDSATLTAAVTTTPANGTLSLNADGSFTYTPNANFNGSDSFTYTTSDGSLSSAPATVTITVSAVNDAPVAVADAYPATEDTPLAVPAPGVLANDTDVDSVTLTAAVATPPANGTLSLNADGSFTYTPNANFNGSDSFSYTTSDGSLSSAPATVTITVSAVNDAPVAVADAYPATEDTPLVVAAPGVLANDTDVDSVTLTAAVATNPANGTLSLNADGSFTYTPNANFNGSDSFTYATSDGSLSSGPATVTITVAGVNDPPVAAADAYTTQEDTPIVVATPGVLANDTDIDSVTLTAVLVTGPANGSLTLNANGSFTYTPNANFNGTDSFTYKANDGSADSNVVTVSITVTAVNDAPVATADAYSTAEDTPLIVNAAGGILANDSDVDGPSISAVLVGNAANGNVALNADGSFTYTPNANFNGTDSFTYKANDTLLDSAVATVTITVSATNDPPVNIVPAAPPVAGEDIGLIFSNAVGDAIQISDPDAGTANVEVSLAVTNGTVTLSQTTGLTFTVGTGTGNSAMTFQGTIAAINAALDNMIFTGSSNYSGPASITITTNDLGNTGSGGPLSDTDTVNLTIMAINDPPLVTAGGTLNYTEGDPATAIDGTITVSDPDNATLASATAQITAGYVIGEDVLGFTNTPNIIGNFDGATGTLTLTGSDTLANYQAALRSITYFNTSATPSAAARTVTWQANDGTAAGQTATSTINLTPKNSAPVITAPAAGTTNEDTPLAFTAGLTISVSDPDAGSAAVNVTLSAANGVLTLAGTTGLTVTGNGTSSVAAQGTLTDLNSALNGLTYVPNADFNGSDTLAIGIDDLGNSGSGGALTDAKSVSITILPVNDAPSFTKGADVVVVDTDPAQSIAAWATALSAGPADEQATQTLSFIVSNDNNALFNAQPSVSPTGTLTFTPKPGVTGTATVTVQIHDDGGTAAGGIDTSAPQTFKITVENVPTITSANAATFSVGTSGSFTITAAASPAATITESGALPSGVTFNGPATSNGATLSGTPQVGSGGIYNISFTATNTHGSSAAQSFTLTVDEIPSVGAQPADTAVCDGATATFTASAATGYPAATVQWQVSTDGGATFGDIVGATATTLSFTAVAANNGNRYRAVFANGSGSVASNAAILTVNTAPVVVTDPASQTVCAGSSATFTAAASGQPVPTVQWQVSTDGGATFNDLGGATSTTLSFSSVAGDNGNQYRARFTNVCGANVTTAAATLTVDTLPVVTTDPLTQTLCEGLPATFTAAATSNASDHTVQWQVDSGSGFTDIPGATSTTLNFVAVAGDQGKKYRALFTDTCGNVASATALLSVDSLPIVATDPVSQAVCAGSTATFTAAATSNASDETVQWQLSTDGGVTFTNIGGATSTTYSFTTASGDTGNQYRATFTTSCGSTNTASATLSVDTLPVVTVNPLTQTLCAGATATFTAAATSNASDHTVQWQVDSGAGFTNIPGATSTTLSFTTTAADNGRQYRAVFTDACGSTNTSAAALTVDTLPVVTTDPVNQTVCAGGTATFAVAATSNTGSHTVQWQVDSGAGFTDIPGATSTTLSFATVAGDNGKQYRAVFTTSCGSVNTATASLRVDTLPVVTSDPSTQTACAGAPATFTAAATSNAGQTVQWQVDSGAGFTDMPGETSTTLTFTTAIGDNGKQYRAVFANACGTVNTAAAALTVDTLPVVTTDPLSQAVCAGGTASFTAAATSNASDHTVQWELSTDGGTTFNPIVGATATTLNFATVAGDNAKQYRAVFTDACGSTATAAATLRVDTLPAVTTNPLTQTICAGGAVTFTAAASSNAGQTVQWEVSSDGGATFNPIVGATSTTLSFATTAADLGRKYHAVFTNACGSTNTSAATLVVDTLPVVTADPGSQSVCAGATATFTSSASSNAGDHTVQWEVSTDGGATFNPVGGATSTTLSFATIPAQNGNQYRAVFSDACGSTTSSAATLTVNTAPAVTANPAPTTVCDSTLATFTASASGSPAPTVQWEVSTDGGATFNPIAGATSTSYSFTASAADNTKQYHAVFTNSCGTATTTAATLTVDTAPAVTTNPTNQTVVTGNAATFTAAANGTPAPTVQWQVSTDSGVTFSDISGATSTTYSFTTVLSDNGKQFRAVFSNSCGVATTNAATLTVTCPTITPARTGGGAFPAGTIGTAYSGQSFTASGGTAGYTFAVTGGTFPSSLSLSSAGVISGTPTATGTFVFTVTATDANGCTGSASFTIPINPSAVGDSYSNLVNNTEAVVTGGSTASPTTPFITLTGTIIANDLPAGGVAATSGTFSSANGTNNVVIAADGTFKYSAPVTASALATDTFSYTITSNTGGTGTPTQATGTVTLNLANRVWYVKNNAAGGGTGQSQSPFNTLAAAQTASTAGDTIFVYNGDGTTTGQNAGITLKANQQLVGEGVALVVNTNTLVAAGTKPQITNATASSDAITLAAGNTVKGLTVTGATRDGIRGTGVAGFTGDTLTIQSNTASGLHFVSMTGTITVTNASISGNGEGVTVGVVGGAAGDGGTATISIDNTNSIAAGAGQREVSIQNRAASAGAITIDAPITDSAVGATGISIVNNNQNPGGTIAFNGNVTLTSGTAQAVTLTTNTNATITFSNLSVTTTTGNGIVASGGGTLTITAGSISAGAAVNALSVNGLAFNATFSSINSSATTGVSLTNVTGTVTINGGTINGTTGIIANGFGTIAVSGVTVSTSGTALNLTSGAVSGTFTNVSSSGGTNGITLTTVTGTVTINGGAITGASGASFNVSGGTVGVTYSGNITQANNSALVNVAGGHTGTLTFLTGTLSATNGTGLVFNNADGTYNFTGPATLNGGSAGISITNGSAGSFGFGTTTSVTGTATGVPFLFDTSTAGVTFSGNLTQAAAARLVSITGQASGTITFQTGTLAGNTSSTGILLNNVDGTVNFNGTNTLSGAATITINNGSAGTIGFSSNSSVTNPSGANFSFDSSNANVTYNGTLTQTGAQRVVSITNQASGTITFQTGTIAANTSSTGILLDNADGTVSFSATNTLSGAAGILIQNGSSGTFSFSSGSSVTNSSAIAVKVNGSTPASMTYAGTITANSNRTVEVSYTNPATGACGSNTFSGSITGNGVATGILIDRCSSGSVLFNNATKSLTTSTGGAVTISNNGATVDFTNGGLVINTTSGAGFAASGGGTVTVQGTGNTVTSTTGTAVNVASTTIGASGITFQSVNKNGNNTAINLTSTGSGFFTVTGTGTTAGTGGTIQNIVGSDAIVLNTTGGLVTLKNMNIQDITAATDASDANDTHSNIDAIQGLSVNGGLTLNNVTIQRISDSGINGSNNGAPPTATVWNGLTLTNCTFTNTNRFNVASHADANNEAAVYILGIKGTVSVTGTAFSNAGSGLVLWTDTSGTLDFTAQSNSFTTLYKEIGTSSIGNYGIDFVQQGSLTSTVRIGDTTNETNAALANTFTNGGDRAAIRVIANTGSTGSLKTSVAKNTFTVTDHSSPGVAAGSTLYNFPQSGVLFRAMGTGNYEGIFAANTMTQCMHADGGLGNLTIIAEKGDLEAIVRSNSFGLPWDAPVEIRADGQAGGQNSAKVQFYNNTYPDGNVGDGTTDLGGPSPYLPPWTQVRNNGRLDLTMQNESPFGLNDPAGYTYGFYAATGTAGDIFNLFLQNVQAPRGYQLNAVAGSTYNLYKNGQVGANVQTILKNNNALGGGGVDTTSPPTVSTSGTINLSASAPALPSISNP